MTWFRIDDGFYDHPKVIHLDMAAVGLWTLAGAYCARHLTDGVITERQIKVIGGTRRQADKLVEAGLWHVENDAANARRRTGDAPANARRYVFNDWAHFQPSRADITAKRNEDAERKREARAKKRATQDIRGNVQPDTPAGVHADTSGGVLVPSALPDPARPDPTIKDLSHSGIPTHDCERENAESENPPASSPPILIAPTVPADGYSMIEIPDDWAPGDLHRAKHPHHDLDTEAEAFRDHAVSTGRLCNRRAGWDAAFSNWLRRAKPPEQPGKAAATTKAEGWLAIANAAGVEPQEAIS